MEEKCRAVVVRAVDYKENDKILTLFSLENGLICASIRGVKKPNAKLKFAVQPFCFCEYVLNVKGDRRSVVGADIIESFYPIREDIVKYYAGSVALEFVNDFMHEGMDGKELFILLMEFLKSLCYYTLSPKIALAKFLFEALGLSGYDLTVHNCHKCHKSLVNRAFFDFNIGASVCEECKTGTDIEVNLNTLKMLSEIAYLPFEGLQDIDYPTMIQNKAIKLLCYYAQIKAGVVLRSAGNLLTLGN